MNFEQLSASSRKEAYSRRREKLRRALKDYSKMPPEAPIRRFIDRTMALYNGICAQKGLEAQRRYRAVMQRYISPKDISHRDFAEYEYITVRTFYKDLNHALDDLMPLVYGVDGIILCGESERGDVDVKAIRKRIEEEIRRKMGGE